MYGCTLNIVLCTTTKVHVGGPFVLYVGTVHVGQLIPWEVINKVKSSSANCPIQDIECYPTDSVQYIDGVLYNYKTRCRLGSHKIKDTA